MESINMSFCLPSNNNHQKKTIYMRYRLVFQRLCKLKNSQIYDTKRNTKNVPPYLFDQSKNLCLFMPQGSFQHKKLLGQFFIVAEARSLKSSSSDMRRLAQVAKDRWKVSRPRDRVGAVRSWPPIGVWTLEVGLHFGDSTWWLNLLLLWLFVTLNS